MLPEDEGLGLVGVRADAHAVDGQESVGERKGGALIAVDEGMDLRHALPGRGGRC